MAVFFIYASGCVKIISFSLYNMLENKVLCNELSLTHCLRVRVLLGVGNLLATGFANDFLPPGRLANYQFRGQHLAIVGAHGVLVFQAFE